MPTVRQGALCSERLRLLDQVSQASIHRARLSNALGSLLFDTMEFGRKDNASNPTYLAMSIEMEEAALIVKAAFDALHNHEQEHGCQSPLP